MSENRYFYFDEEASAFMEVLPGRLEVYTRAFAFVVVLMVLASLLFPRLAA